MGISKITWSLRDGEWPEYENVEDGKKGEGDEVEENQVHPCDVDLNVVRILAQKFCQSRW